ncbi:TIGR03854 family LLM class F420-dependent oxidoreductase [Amycolatopsis anabasis]|uniref:TIGR03854 family LLM class F420-dependent oxidoreductase n=1 Tax=Amycolatopsis anabasis TaxID=1840409 RepID=UPI00131CF4B7|nr:TIGR03854 family LLM class F420-dependent oxidoreductase [Amycolatopsis anabasis]
MKVRIGVGLGAEVDPTGFADAVDEIERFGIDSLWLPEVVFSPQVDPFIGMAHALSRTSRLKVGTGVAVLPGRHPVLVAKQLASLAALAPARVLPVFGLQPARKAERQAFEVPPGRRAAVLEESLRLVRLLLEKDEVSFSGEFFTVEGARISPKPRKPLDLWLGGSAPAALNRVGRLADGWLASFLTPDQALRGRETIQAAAEAAGREIEDDHYGISLAVTTDGIPPELAALARDRQPDTDPADLIATGWDHARELVKRFIDAGLTKFVIRPAGPITSYAEFLDRFTTHMLPLQN